MSFARFVFQGRRKSKWLGANPSAVARHAKGFDAVRFGFVGSLLEPAFAARFRVAGIIQTAKDALRRKPVVFGGQDEARERRRRQDSGPARSALLSRCRPTFSLAVDLQESIFPLIYLAKGRLLDPAPRRTIPSGVCLVVHPLIKCLPLPSPKDPGRFFTEPSLFLASLRHAAKTHFEPHLPIRGA